MSLGEVIFVNSNFNKMSYMVFILNLKYKIDMKMSYMYEI